VDAPWPKRINRVAILAEHRLFRDAIACCLTRDSDFAVVGHAASAGDLFGLCELRHPDVVLVSVSADIAGALTVLAGLRERFRGVRVVVVYEDLSPAELAEIWRAGVDHLVPASHGLDALRLVLRRCAPGPDVDPDAPTSTGELTDEERKILALVSGGHTVGRIAELLDTTTHVVENHKRRIYGKLDVVSQSQAVARASALGIIGRPPPRVARHGDRVAKPLAILRGPGTRIRERAVVALLSAGMPFCIENGSAPTARQRWDWLHRGPVLLVLLDPRPADWLGPELARLPVVLVRHGPPHQPEGLDPLSQGIVAVVSADRVVDDLVPALNLAASGFPPPGGAEAESLLESLLARRPYANPGLPELTTRESEILRSIARGHTVRQTARSLGIATKTVENTQARLFRKLGARNRAGALATAHALGLVEAVEADPTQPARIAAPAGPRTRWPW